MLGSSSKLVPPENFWTHYLMKVISCAFVRHDDKMLYSFPWLELFFKYSKIPNFRE